MERLNVHKDYNKCPICGKEVYITYSRDDRACSDPECDFAIGEYAYFTNLKKFYNNSYKFIKDLSNKRKEIYYGKIK